jgi:hypothetical protein
LIATEFTLRWYCRDRQGQRSPHGTFRYLYFDLMSIISTQFFGSDPQVMAMRRLRGPWIDIVDINSLPVKKW